MPIKSVPGRALPAFAAGFLVTHPALYFVTAVSVTSWAICHGHGLQQSSGPQIPLFQEDAQIFCYQRSHSFPRVNDGVMDKVDLL
jgi:hypothetical protein